MSIGTDGFGSVVSGILDGDGVRGPATGDLSEEYPNPTVSGLQGHPIAATTPVTGMALEYVSGTWTPKFRYNSTIANIYVNNATGNDANDGLTTATAKKTIQAGVNAAGTFIKTVSPGFGYVIVRIAAQNTTENVSFNGIYSLGPGGPGGSSASAATVGIYLFGEPTQTILSGPHLLTAVSTIDPNNPVGSPSTIGGQATITSLGAGWTPSAFKGKFVRVAGGSIATLSPIVDNTADTLTIVKGGTFAVGNNVNIVEPATTINGSIRFGATNVGIGIYYLTIKGPTLIPPVVFNNQLLPVDYLYQFVYSRLEASGDGTQNSSVVNRITSSRITQCVLKGDREVIVDASANTNATLSRTLITGFCQFRVFGAKKVNLGNCVLDNMIANTNFAAVGNLFFVSEYFGMGSVTLKNMLAPYSVGGGNTLDGNVATYQWSNVLFYQNPGTTVNHVTLYNARLPNVYLTTFVNGNTAIFGYGAQALSGLQASGDIYFSGCSRGIFLANGSYALFGKLVFLSGVGTGIELESNSNIVVAGGNNSLSFDGTLFPVILNQRSVAYFAGAPGAIGTGNAANPLFTVDTGSRLMFRLTPSLTGGSTDIRLDNAINISYAETPYCTSRLTGASFG